MAGSDSGQQERAHRSPGRPAVISRERIVEAVASADNLDRLTMRQLAASLGVSHGALYRWVANRDELFDLISEVLVERVLHTLESPEPAPGAEAEADDADPTDRLARLAWAMHDEYLALPGFATHLSRPHRHNAHSVDRLRSAVVEAFVGAGVEEDLAEQSWHIFVTCTVSWLAASETPSGPGPSAPPFEVFLGVLLRGLPASHPADRPHTRLT